MKNAFYFMLKALFVFKIFVFLFRLVVYVGKRFDRKTKINLKIYNVTEWIINNYNTYIS